PGRSRTRGSFRSAAPCTTRSWATPSAGPTQRRPCPTRARPLRPSRARGSVRVLAASWVVPVSAPPIRDGRIAVEDGRIAWVGSQDSADGPRGELVDLGDGVLLPGLVNAHCHLELTGLRDVLASAVESPSRASRFVPWVRELIRARGVQEATAARQAT